jgi:hypothetical protein
MLGTVLSYFTPGSLSLWELFCRFKYFVREDRQLREGCAMEHTKEFRAKAFELLSLAESVNDPERRAEMLRFARMWMSLSEPMPDLRSAYELPRRAKAA